MYSLTNWSERQVNPDLGRCLFSFVLIADTHVDREDLPSSSPFPVNALCNARTRYCIADIQRLARNMGELAPKFTIHLGDLTHPVPSMAAYATAVADFHDIASQLDMPLYLIPGNHDVGDKPVEWAPAGVVCNRFLSAWNDHFGHHYQSFSQGGVMFVLLNAQIINSGLALEHQQRLWLETTLKSAQEQRIMLFLHYPPYLYQADEAENYDNLAEPGRTWLLNLTEKYQIEALFSGHVHHFWYNRHQSTDCYLLPSTSFTRQDYSEMFRATPTTQMADGRDDADKVGYFLVLVYENGHVCHFRNTKGMTQMRKAQRNELPTAPAVIALHPREATRFPVGFDMRHPWVEVTEIAPSGALDEFSRKQIRNDYPLFALWQMGTGLMRVPTSDFQDDQTLARMQALHEFGHRFVVTSVGVPDEGVQQCLVRHKDLVKRWEITIPMDKFPELTRVLRTINAADRPPIYLSKLRMKSDGFKDGEPYYHQISHGFSIADEAEINALLQESNARDLFTGAVFRITRSASVSKSLAEIAAICNRLDMRASATLFMADANPALHRCDDHDNANRIAEGVFTAATSDHLELFVDTFIDLDRGHSVRNGVIDRFCNPRPAMFVVRHLNAILNSKWAVRAPVSHGSFDNGRWVCTSQDKRSQLLILANKAAHQFVLSLNDRLPEGQRQALDLISGAMQPVSIANSDAGSVLEFKAATAGPLLILWKH